MFVWGVLNRGIPESVRFFIGDLPMYIFLCRLIPSSNYSEHLTVQSPFSLKKCHISSRLHMWFLKINCLIIFFFFQFDLWDEHLSSRLTSGLISFPYDSIFDE